MTFEEALTYLGSIQRVGMSLGTARMERLAQRMGRPDRELKFIHIAGTNGKGSTSAFCAQMLQEAGYRVGLFTSPHLIQINERVQINRTPIADEAIAEGMAALRPLIEAARAEGEDAVPTYFEALTALALWYFARQRVDWVVWETGLGGLMDSTNIVTPRMCILTSISLDHEKWLGATVPEIAAQKAGIIKPGVPAVVSARDPQAVAVFEARARELGAPLLILGRDFSVHSGGTGPEGQRAVLDGTELALGLIGFHQVDNAAGARAALGWLRERAEVEITDGQIADGLRRTRWMGRFEVLQSDPPFVVDGGHNLDGVRMAIETWRACYGALAYELVCGFVDGKNHAALLGFLLPQASRVTLVGLASHRSTDPNKLAELCGDKPVVVEESLSAAWPRIAQRALVTPTFVCGSLFLVGELLALREGRGHQLLLNERLDAVAAAKA
jgi:dihydrofolate synthase/folylpolyglutamate synthase